MQELDQIKYSNPRITFEFLTPSPRHRGGLGWGKNLRLLQGLLYNRCNCERYQNIRQAKGNSMTVKFILSEYVDKAMAEAMYDKLENDSFVGKIPVCKGVIAFGSTLKECQNELRSTLEDWILLGLKLRHRMPIIDNIDLNQEPSLEPLDTL